MSSIFRSKENKGVKKCSAKMTEYQFPDDDNELPLIFKQQLELFHNKLLYKLK